MLGDARQYLKKCSPTGSSTHCRGESGQSYSRGGGGGGGRGMVHFWEYSNFVSLHLAEVDMRTQDGREQRSLTFLAERFLCCLLPLPGIT